MSYLNAHFPDQRSAMAAMDKVLGRGLGHARVQPLASKGNAPSPSEQGLTRLEVQLGQGVNVDDVRALLGPLGASDLTLADETATPFPVQGETGTATQRDDVKRAIQASERGAKDATGPSHDPQVERTDEDKRTRHDPHR